MGRRIFVEPALPPVPATTAVAGQAGRWPQEERREALGVEAAVLSRKSSSAREDTRPYTSTRMRVSTPSAAAVPHRGMKEARCTTACRGKRAPTHRRSQSAAIKTFRRQRFHRSAPYDIISADWIPFSRKHSP
jgi:hypothetical protein